MSLLLDCFLIGMVLYCLYQVYVTRADLEDTRDWLSELEEKVNEQK